MFVRCKSWDPCKSCSPTGVPGFTTEGQVHFTFKTAGNFSVPLLVESNFALIMYITEAAPTKFRHLV